MQDRYTSAHDVAVWLDDLPQISALVEAEGWRRAPAPDEDEGTGFERRDVRFELTYLIRRGDGRIVTPLRDLDAPWPDGALSTRASCSAYEPASSTSRRSPDGSHPLETIPPRRRRTARTPTSCPASTS
jgi:hypothetical protein